MSIEHHERARSRRDFLVRAGGGFGALAFCALSESDFGGPALGAAEPDPGRSPAPFAPRAPHFRARAKNVIWCFLDGGPSHVDLFDPKPLLNRLAGESLPASFPRPVTAMGRTANTPLLATKRVFRRHGQSGTWVSDWYPEIAKHVDEIALIRSCHADGLNHVGSVCQMNTGAVLGGRPCLGAWSVYGLGTENQDLPGFVVLCDYPEDPPGGSRNWGTGFMPGAYQGTKFREGSSPILYLNPPDELSGPRQRRKLDLLAGMNRGHLATRQDAELEARVAAYELAYRMQAAGPEAVDLAEESAETLVLYGMDKKPTERVGRNCLLARRLVERGVRFVQLYCGSGSKWDAHTDVEGNHGRYCLESDQPIAGLLTDLKRRGLLDETLVIWGGEFGRTPMSESGNGRDHNPYGFSMWLAGGGVKGGLTYGATDDLGLYAVEKKTHVNDLHATILRLLGMDHVRLTYPHNGLDQRLTMNAGVVAEEILA